jgi:hypothetical protein
MNTGSKARSVGTGYRWSELNIRGGYKRGSEEQRQGGGTGKDVRCETRKRERLGCSEDPASICVEGPRLFGGVPIREGYLDGAASKKKERR